MSHREILEVLVGLMSALFVAIVSATIVSTALPTIIADLDGTQTQYTWVVTASLLAMTVTSPIWSKLSDLYNKKVLVQVAIVIFLLGSLAAGAVQNVPELLAARAVQGLGMGGLVSLAQAILGSIIPPRERGRYSGYLAATMAVATVSGPLLGGVVVDVAGWRWCFWVAVPFAVVALVMLQKFLHLETIRRPVKIDYWGALFITIAASLPLVWVSFAGNSFAWWSVETAEFLGAASSRCSQRCTSSGVTSTRWCRRASSATGSPRSRSWRAWPWVSRSSAPRSSWRSTSRSPAATRPPRPAC